MDVAIVLDDDLDLRDFIHLIEKTTQIQSLMFSNNATCDITEIMTHRRMKSYLEHVVELARAALYLKNGHYGAFAETLCTDFELRALTIQNLNKGYSANDFFKITLKTRRGNEVMCEGFYLRNCLSILSQKIISDLLIVETSNNFQADAHRLLKLSSDLSMLSLVLDEQFVPRRKIKHTRLKQYAKSA